MTPAARVSARAALRLWTNRPRGHTSSLTYPFKQAIDVYTRLMDTDSQAARTQECKEVRHYVPTEIR